MEKGLLVRETLYCAEYAACADSRQIDSLVVDVCVTTAGAPATSTPASSFLARDRQRVAL